MLALPAEDGRLWTGGKRPGWNRGHDLAAGDSVRAVALALRCGLAAVQRAEAAPTARLTLTDAQREELKLFAETT